MSEQIDWSKAPEGAEFWCDDQWFKVIGGEWFTWYPGALSWAEPAYNAPDNFSWWGSAVERPITPSWSGEGLPPVGVVCEALYMGQPQGVVTVRYSGQCMILWSEDRSSEQCGQAEHYLFRPIRTPEQIAAELADQAIKEIAGIICRDGAFDIDDPEVTESAAALYDAGYRKQEKTE